MFLPSRLFSTFSAASKESLVDEINELKARVKRLWGYL